MWMPGHWLAQWQNLIRSISGIWQWTTSGWLKRKSKWDKNGFKDHFVHPIMGKMKQLPSLINIKKSIGLNIFWADETCRMWTTFPADNTTLHISKIHSPEVVNVKNLVASLVMGTGPLGRWVRVVILAKLNNVQRRRENDTGSEKLPKLGQTMSMSNGQTKKSSKRMDMYKKPKNCQSHVSQVNL